jgi:hypothetical protein
MKAISIQQPWGTLIAHGVKDVDVKGRLGVWDIPEIDENNLPETVDIPKIERKGKTLTYEDPAGNELNAMTITFILSHK